MSDCVLFCFLISLGQAKFSGFHAVRGGNGNVEVWFTILNNVLTHG